MKNPLVRMCPIGRVASWNSSFRVFPPERVYISDRISKAKIYVYHRSKIAKAGPGSDDRPDQTPVQTNSSSPCLTLFPLVRDTLYHHDSISRDKA